MNIMQYGNCVGQYRVYVNKYTYHT